MKIEPDDQAVSQEQELVPIIVHLVQIVMPLLFYRKQEASAPPEQLPTTQTIYGKRNSNLPYFSKEEITR